MKAFWKTVGFDMLWQLAGIAAAVGIAVLAAIVLAHFQPPHIF